MATAVVPSLSTDGWVTNKQSQMEKMFSYFLESDYSQSDTFYGSIASLKYILSAANNDMDMAHMIDAALSNMYKNYYDTVNVIVDISIDPQDKSVTNINIDVNATYRGASYTLSSAVSATNGDIVNYDKALGQLYTNRGV